ncbi:hypothetical protein F4808DRAFT_452301 [Astrocystis sublimbata]|nr:hypothetical protein F4808DRAFT_452301 [Astrocystis sublimbata]
MFPIDVSLLPSLATRKALLVVDAQNDFLAEDGALPVKMPIDLAQSISDFAGDFRRNGGEIIWVQSRFESSRPVDEEQILISDVTKPPPGSAPAPPRGRRPRASPTETETAPYSPEAFLTLGPGNGPQCVRDRTPGMEMHPTIKQSLGPRDHVLTKTFYSAFKVDELLRLLRMRLVTELFICGSSTNVGVMATAIDAAMYGYTITIVDDCCGAQSMSRHRMALRQITSTTGCETLSASKVLSMMRPSPPKKPQVSHSHSHHQRQERDRGVAAAAGGGKSPTVRVRRVRDDNAAAAVADVSSSVSEILQPSLERLSLSGEPAVADEYAPETTPVASPQQQQQQPQSRSRSQPRSRRALQSLAGDDASLPSSLKNTRHSETRSDLGSSDNISKSNLNNIGDSNNNSNTTPNMSPHPKASEPLCEGDTRVLYDVLPPSLSTSIFSRLQSEVAWARMSHQGGEVPRLVAVQGLVAPDGSKPVYRHPADASPPLHAFTPAVDEVRRVVEAHLGHELNHVLIQLYRTGEDYISEHSDKTLDIARGSYIANVSLGAERTMTLRTKRKPKKAFEGECEGGGGGKGGGVGGVETEDKDALKRTTQRAPLPHNSLFQMGLSTNARWLHGVRADKRLAREKSAAELSHSGERISLTFRRIATYLSADESLIWGQGATSKTRDAARGVVNGQTEEAVKMVRAFGRENQDTEFDWDRHYGEGFDVLHIGDAKRLFMSGDKVVDLRIRALAAQLGVSYARGMLGGEGGGAGAAGKGDMGGGDGEGGKKTLDIPIRFVDNDAPKTSVDGQAEIMLYLQRTYGGGPADNEDENKERVCGRWREGLELLDKWRSLSTPASSSDIDDILALLAPWEQYAGENTFIAGPSPSAADFAFWPVLRDVLDSSSPLLAQALLSGTGTEGTKEGNIVGLRAYDERMNVLEAIKRLLGS